MKKLLIPVLYALLINLAFLTSAIAQAGQPRWGGGGQGGLDKESQRVYKVRHGVDKIGIGENIQLKLQDGTKLKGRLSEIGEDYFVVADSKTGFVTRLTFAQVKAFRIRGANPFADPAALIGLAFIPVIIVAATSVDTHRLKLNIFSTGSKSKS